MTAGYDPSNPVASGSSEGYDDRPRHAAGDDSERLGPLPPRITQTGSIPTHSIPPPVATPPVSIPPQPTSSWPVSAGPPPHSVPPAPPVQRRSPLAAVALALAVLLLIVAGVEAAFIVSLQHKVDQTDAAVKAAATGDASRFKAIEDRADKLEQKTGGSLDAAAVAESVRPSVFRVTTKYAIGTGFALGKAPAGGGTNLITNYHVVADAYEKGEKDVNLERTDQRFPGKIVEVHPDKDLAVLHTDEEFAKLAPAAAVPKVGDPVLVIGSPMGLEDTVTTGVVSAFRTLNGEALMQFDAAINPGNSGGPVFNAKKEVVGVATLKAQQAEGIGLAIPISVVCDTVPSVC
ncbi:trypsin-like peptidase domain-containing protein [Dactylosporangium sp. NPDC049140]|uniref:S1C family serine protease n=1 Tax=Dactylosporangium sp. NPDC049140 TaxID=3155647 RepID=UPI0033EEB047